MCSHYEAPSHPQIMKAFGVEGPEQGRLDLWPTYMGPFLRRPKTEEAQDEPGPALEVLSGSFGLIPGWSKDTKIARRTYSARSKTAAKKPSFRRGWKNGQHCIIPAAAIYEPDWRSGKAIPTRIARADGDQQLARLAKARYLEDVTVREQMRIVGIRENADRTYRNWITRLHNKVHGLLISRLLERYKARRPLGSISDYNVVSGQEAELISKR